MVDPSPPTIRNMARRERIRGVRASLFVTVVLAAVASAVSGSIAAEGLMLGGIAGALGYWIMSLRLERIAMVRPDKLAVAATVWTFYRLAIYGAFLFFAYRLDTEDSKGLLAGIAGLLSTRFAVVFLAIRDSGAAGKPKSPG